MSDIFSYNGGSIVAMRGKDSVSLGCDRRLGQQFATLSTQFQRVFKIQDNILLGLSGLATDIETFKNQLIYKVNLYKLRENRDIKARTFLNLVSTSLYEKRFGPFFVTPIVIGLDKDNNGKIETILATYDSIGQIDEGDFATGGTASEMLFGVCESFFTKDLPHQHLQETLSQVLTSGLDRDALSGWGGLVYTITEGNLNVKELKTKMT